MRVNVIGTYNALEAALATEDTLERFVDFSTSEVFGTHAFNVEEGQVSTIGSVGEARWTYAVSKLAGEHMAHAYHDELRLPTVTVHPFNVFGPGQIGGGAIRAFIEAALAGRDLTIHGDGSQIRAWSYVTDMVARRPRCASSIRQAVGQAFNIGNPRVAGDGLRPRAADQAASPARRARSSSSRSHYADVELRIPNVEKARELLGWEPRVELDDGLEKTIAWYRQKRSHPPSAGPTLGARRARRGGRGARERHAHDGAEGAEFEAEIARALRGRARARRLLGHCRAPPRRARRSGSSRATRCWCRRTPSRRRRTSSRSRA